MSGDAPRTGDTARDLLRRADRIMRGQHDPVEWLIDYDAYLNAPAQQDDALAAKALRQVAFQGGQCLVCGGFENAHESHGGYECIVGAALEARPPATDAGLPYCRCCGNYHQPNYDTLPALSARPESTGGQ